MAQFTGTPLSGSSPLTVKFSNTSTGSISSYSWSFGDGAGGTLAAPSHTYAAAGVYTVSLTVTCPGGSNTQTRTKYVMVAARVTTALPVAQFTDTAPPFLDTGLYRKLVPGTGTAYYRFMLDYNFDHVSNVTIPFGTAGDVPLVGYMSPGGKSSLITYRNGQWNIDTNRERTADEVVRFGGMSGDIPLAANFSGPGALDDLVIYNAGVWYVDRDLDGKIDPTFQFGDVPGDVPLG